MRARLIDISKYQKSLHPQDNLDGIIIRAGYGMMKDQLFEILTEAAQPIPVRGAYHYFSSNVPWKSQAELFLRHIEDKGFHFYMLDFERAFNNKSSGFAAGASKWIAYVTERTEKKVGLYTNYSTYTDWLKPYGNWMRAWPLWLAQWKNADVDIAQPNLPRGATSWTLWQYSADGNRKGAEYGVGSRDVDLNVFNGTVEELHSWAGVELPEPPPPLPPPDPPPDPPDLPPTLPPDDPPIPPPDNKGCRQAIIDTIKEMRG